MDEFIKEIERVWHDITDAIIKAITILNNYGDKNYKAVKGTIKLYKEPFIKIKYNARSDL